MKHKQQRNRSSMKKMNIRRRRRKVKKAAISSSAKKAAKSAAAAKWHQAAKIASVSMLVSAWLARMANIVALYQIMAAYVARRKAVW